MKTWISLSCLLLCLGSTVFVLEAQGSFVDRSLSTAEQSAARGGCPTDCRDSLGGCWGTKPPCQTDADCARVFNNGESVCTDPTFAEFCVVVSWSLVDCTYDPVHNCNPRRPYNGTCYQVDRICDTLQGVGPCLLGNGTQKTVTQCSN
jgi:hypothetical protein